MPQARGGLGLALRPSARLSLAGDDLQRDVEPGLLVAGEPDGARAAAPEGAQGPVTSQRELGRRAGSQGLAPRFKRG